VYCKKEKVSGRARSFDAALSRVNLFRMTGQTGVIWLREWRVILLLEGSLLGIYKKAYILYTVLNTHSMLVPRRPTVVEY
jgi:hypothetical protein